MKRTKCALGLVAVLTAAAGLSACDMPTPNSKGAIFTYTDAQGNRIGYTTEDLLKDYQSGGSSLSTQFDKVYEVLIRHYYEDDSQATVLAELESLATTDVVSAKQTAQTNADENGTSYESEFEIILDSAGVENVDQLYQHYLYERETARFQEDIYQTFGTGDSSINGIEVMRDGGYQKDGGWTPAFPSSEKWGIGNGGWLKEQVPFHVRHILVKLSAGASGEYTQDKITESAAVGEGGEATKLANVILALAGASSNDVTEVTSRLSFGQIAQSSSDDTGSGAQFGEIGLMEKHMTSDLVDPFKLGTYAFETMYSKRTYTTDYGNETAYRLTPGLRSDATSSPKAGAEKADVVDDTLVLDNADGTETTVYDFFDEMGVGQIPFGAAVALLEEAKVITDDNGNPVNESNDTFFPRNIIYNKYFNKRNVCVITPNAIAMNAQSDILSEETKTAASAVENTVNGGYVTAENSIGVPVDQFKALPGFKVDTKNVVDVGGENVLTDSNGNVILAVRAGADSYQGIHFIVVERSALSEYGVSMNENGQYVENEEAVTNADVATLSEYYSTVDTNSSRYPTYTVDGSAKDKTTYANFNTQSISGQGNRINTVTGMIRGYNDNLQTYYFQSLVEKGSIEFTDKAMEGRLQTYVQTKRQASVDDDFTYWSDHWTDYAEVIQAQEEERAIGSETGTGYLISEVCAMGYGNHDANDPLWQPGGACYYSTR